MDWADSLTCSMAWKFKGKSLSNSPSLTGLPPVLNILNILELLRLTTGFTFSWQNENVPCTIYLSHVSLSMTLDSESKGPLSWPRSLLKVYDSNVSRLTEEQSSPLTLRTFTLFVITSNLILQNLAKNSTLSYFEQVTNPALHFRSRARCPSLHR